MVEVKPKTTVKLRAAANCPSHARSDVKTRDLSIAIDEPVERGGTNLGPSPTETALAALIGCTNVIGHKCAKSLGIEIGHMDIAVTCDFDRRGVTLAEEIDVPFKRIELDVAISGGTSQSDLDRLAAEVAKFCPLAKLFVQAGTEIVQTWRPA